MKHTYFKTLAFLIFSLFAFNANAITIDSDGHTILDFEDLSAGQVNTYGQINFSSDVFTDGSIAAAISFDTNTPIFTLTPDGTATFDLFDAELKGFGFGVDPFEVNVTATYLDGSMNTSNILLTTDFTKYDFNLFNVQSVEFSSTVAGVIAMDNIDVPEPSTLALLGLGLLGLCIPQLKRKS